MFRTLLERLIRRKNPLFQLDPSLPTSLLLELFWQKGLMKIRAQRLWLRGKRPGGLFLGRGVRFFALSKIKWGRFVQLEEGVFVSGLGTGGVHFGDGSRLGAHSRAVVSTTFDQPGRGIVLGKNVGIGEFAYLGGAGGLEIGDDCIIGQYFSAHPENHLFERPDRLIRQQGSERKGICIGPNCWIGAKVTVLDGVELGAGCVVAAGAVVTRSFPSGSVVGGVPAKMLRKREGFGTQEAAFLEKIALHHAVRAAKNTLN